MVTRRRGSVPLILLGCLLIVVGIGVFMCTAELFGSRETYVFSELENAHGVPVEKNADGSTKVARAAITLGVGEPDEIVLEKMSYYDGKDLPAREVIRTPTREIVHERGQKPRVVRDERALLGRWGVLPPYTAYVAVACVACVVGLGVIAWAVILRLRRPRPGASGRPA